MGLETDCTAIWKRRHVDGHALLETNEVIFRATAPATLRVKLSFATLTAVETHEGRLRLTGPAGTLTLALGAAATRWAERIRTPRPVIDKLGVKPGQRVSVLGVDDPAFRRELAARAGQVITGRTAAGSALVFLAVTRAADLARLAAIEKTMARDGGVWAVWAKGRRELGEDHIRGAARRAGLVDVKVVAFSPTHSALKLVIPLARR